MPSTATPATDLKPRRTQRTHSTLNGPTKPAPPPSGLNYGKRPKGITIDLADYITLDTPDLPQHLTALLETPPSTPDLLDAAANYIFAAIAEGTAMNDVDRTLALPLGTVNGWVVSNPERLTRLCLALTQAADLYDVAARRVLAGVGSHPASTFARIGLSAANSLRCEAEGRRRLAESLGRKVTTLAEHTETKKREAVAKRQTKAAEAAAKAEDAQRRSIHEQAVQARGALPPPPREAIQPIGSPMSQAEFDALDMYENTLAVRQLNSNDAAGLTKLADDMRTRWLRQHGVEMKPERRAKAKAKLI